MVLQFHFQIPFMNFHFILLVLLECKPLSVKWLWFVLFQHVAKSWWLGVKLGTNRKRTSSERVEKEYLSLLHSHSNLISPLLSCCSSHSHSAWPPTAHPSTPWQLHSPTRTPPPLPCIHSFIYTLVVCSSAWGWDWLSFHWIGCRMVTSIWLPFLWLQCGHLSHSSRSNLPYRETTVGSWHVGGHDTRYGGGVWEDATWPGCTNLIIHCQSRIKFWWKPTLSFCCSFFHLLVSSSATSYSCSSWSPQLSQSVATPSVVLMWQ